MEPTRLLEDVSTPDEVREHLRRAGQASPDSLDLPRALARFSAAVAVANAAAIGGSNVVPTAGKATGAKLAKLALAVKGSPVLVSAVGAIGIAAACVATWTVVASTGSTRPTPAEGAPALVATGSAPSTSATPATVSVPTAVGDGTPTVSVDSLPSVTPVAAARPSSAPSTDPLADELAHMLELRRLAGDDPRGAVRMAEEGHRRFQGGMLYQERESVAILALARSGRRDVARARASVFLASFPESPFAERVRATMEAP